MPEFLLASILMPAIQENVSKGGDGIGGLVD
jgi:hypothetical protein